MIVKIENLVKKYGDLVALNYFSLDIQEGEIFGLLGPNGSGKSTVIHCLLSLLNYDKGTIELFGKPMSPVAYDLKKEIGVVMQNVAVFNELTVYENIDYFCGLYIQDKKKRKALVEEAVAFVGLEKFRKFLPGKLSGGLLRRLNIACGIAHKPKLIFMDEPTVAVDPQSRNQILEGIRELNRNGATIIYTSHYMEEVEQLCTRIMIMDEGRSIACGTNDELKALVRTGEKITISVVAVDEKALTGIRNLPGVIHLEQQENQLIIQSEIEKHTLHLLLNFLKEQSISYTNIYAEAPTLNDVFLEITGKQLRE